MANVTKILLRLIAILLLAPQVLSASIDLSKLPPQVPVKNDHYKIDSVEDAKEAGILKFKVTSPHAVYEVEGFRQLIKLLHEIQVIERIRTNKEGTGFFDGAAASVENTVDGIENLVTHPIQSAKGLGQAAGKIGRGIGGMFRKKEEGEKSSFGEKVLGSNEREIAKEFGVDVYSSNPYLRAIINKMARARLGGQSAVMVVKLLVPIAMVASIAVAAGGINGAADQLVNDTDRKELYRLNKEALLGMGLEEEAVIKILNLEYFSPREQTYLRFYFERLQKVEGFLQLIQNAGAADSEWNARRGLYEMEMAAALSEKSAAKRIWDFPEGLALLNEQGELQVVTAYDDLSGGLEGKILDQMEQIQKETGARDVAVYNTGAISEGMMKDLQKKRFQGYSWACLESENE